MESRAVPRTVWVLAAAHVVVLALVIDRYGFHRDELYFVEAARHLAFGYVDQPPLVPALAWIQDAVLGDGVWALRVLPAVASAGSVVLASLLAAEFGGERRARVLAAGATAGALFVLSTGHLLSTATFDFMFWLAAIVVAARMLRTDDPRWWVAFGAVGGLALWNKQMIVLLAISLVVGLAVTGRRSLLEPRWLAAGAGLALLVAAPTLVWQAANDWPQVQMAGALSERIGGENRITLLPLQLVLLGPLLVPLGISGIRWLRRDAPGSTFRPLLWAYGVALLLTLASGGRPYYPLPLAATIIVAGIVGREAAGRPRTFAYVAANAVLVLPLALPVLPLDVLAETPIGDANDTLIETVGWPELADQVAGIVASLPPDEREDVVLLAGSYGEAGALDRFGPELSLPQAYSGHNSYWHWRRPQDDAATVVAVRMSGEFLTEQFRSCDRVATIDNGHDVDNELQGQAIWVCRGLIGTWAEAWPEFRHYN